MTMERWVWMLECGHSILDDDAEGTEERCYCPACGMSCLVTDSYVYRDEDVST